MPLAWGFRDNISALPLWASWGLSGLEGLAGLLIVGIALAEAVPGRLLSARVLAPTLALGAALVMADGGAGLFCWVSSPRHVLMAHGGAIVAVTLLAAGASVLVDRARARRVSWVIARR
jgi:hypothetical protein